VDQVLILVRHAVAFPHDPARWPDDSRRPLTPKGERVSHEAARGFGRLAPVPDVVLASPFPRAWRTAEILEEEAGWPPPRPTEALQKERTPAEAMEAVEAVRAQAGSAVMALVGHEPNLTELASTLLAGDASAVRIELDKGGALALGFQNGDPAQPTLRWLVTQEVLRSLGR
jgi:phosphohistidine phosphatase